MTAAGEQMIRHPARKTLKFPQILREFRNISSLAATSPK
jgi:hypothetical protein